MKKFLSLMIVFFATFLVSAQETESIWNHYEALKTGNQKSVRIVKKYIGSYVDYMRGNDIRYDEYVAAQKFLFARKSGEFNAIFQAVKDKNDFVFDLLYPAFRYEIDSDAGYASTSYYEGYIFEFAIYREYIHALESIDLNISSGPRMDELFEMAAAADDKNVSSLVYEKLLKNRTAGSICSCLERNEKPYITGIRKKTLDINFKYPLSDEKTLVLDWCYNSLGKSNGKKMLEYLIKNGADLNVADKYGHTPLSYVFVNDKCRKTEIFELLIKSGADVGSAERSYGENFSFVEYAIKNKIDIKIIRTLIEGGAALNPEGKERGLIATAIYENRKDVADLLIEKGADINAPGFSSYTPLSRACHNADVALVEKLLKKGAEVNAFYNDDRDSNPLFETVYNEVNEKSVKIFDMLIEHGADIHLDIGGDYYVLTAVGYKGTYFLEYFLKNGLSANSKYKNGMTAVMDAAGCLNLKALKLLSEYKADFKAVDEEGRNALMFAVRTLSKIDSDKHKYELDIIDFLLSKSIKINSVNEYKNTALHMACEGSNKDLVKKLIEKGADVNARNKYSYPPLYYALKNVGMVNLLIDSGADLNLDVDGKPLYRVCENCASYQGDETVKKSASIILSRSKGKNISLVEFCALGNFEEAKKMLKTSECDVNQLDDNKCSALFYVVGTSDVELAKMLIEKGADVNVYGNLIYPLLWKAAVANQHDMVRLLIANGAKMNLIIDISYGYHSLLAYLCDSYYTKKNDYLEMIKILVENGEDVNLPGGYETSYTTETSFIRSLDHAPLEVVSYLYSKGGNLFSTVRLTKYYNQYYGFVEIEDLRPEIRKFVEDEIKKMFIGKKKKTSENLKIRESSNLYSDVVDIIGKNNSVEIIEVGKMARIDDINSIWVKVKVVPGAKNTSGKTMDHSVTGWCFAGYLK